MGLRSCDKALGGGAAHAGGGGSTDSVRCIESGLRGHTEVARVGAGEASTACGGRSSAVLVSLCGRSLR